MHEAVSDILLDRARENEGINRMVLVSLFLHALLIAIIILMPASWRRSSTTADVTPMMITLSNAGTGPDTGGLTAISNKPVQVQAPAEARPTPVAPPASKPNRGPARRKPRATRACMRQPMQATRPASRRSLKAAPT